MKTKTVRKKRFHTRRMIVELNFPTAAIPGHVIRAAKYPHRPLASLWVGGGTHGVPTQIANAVLMAESGSLLDALESFVDYFDRHGGENNPATPIDQYRNAKAVIDRATRHPEQTRKSFD